MTRIRFSSRTVLLLYCWAAVSAVSASITAMVEAGDTSSAAGGLRNNNKQKTDSSTYKRQSVIRRLYGPENGSVRKHVRLLEEQSQRSQTGFLGDPNHKVPYENHPYDPDSPTFVGRRRLDESGYTTEDPTEDLYKPLRIKFVTTALDNLRSDETAAKIDFIKTQILPP